MSNDATRNATVTVSSSSISLYELGREAFNKLLGPVMKKKIAKTADERKEITELKTVSGLGDFLAIFFFLLLFFSIVLPINVVLFKCSTYIWTDSNIITGVTLLFFFCSNTFVGAPR
jgi:fatty acid desaturase